MKKQTNSQEQKSQSPSVRIASPKGRPIQLRYFDPNSGKEIRISTGTYNEDEAAEEKRRLEAKLVLGLSTTKQPAVRFDESMPWEYFREQYSKLHLRTLRQKSVDAAESRLDIAEEILAPSSIGEAFDSDALNRLQVALLDGVNSRRGKPRSRRTVKSYMTSVLASANWAYDQGWLREKPRFRKLKVSKTRAMRGRPITTSEFTTLLEHVEEVVGPMAKTEWQRLLKGLWVSGLRLGEILAMGWDESNLIVPVWKDGQAPVLRIAAVSQKNDTEEEIPLLPWFEELLLETSEESRTGFVFNPVSLQQKYGRSNNSQRPKSDWVGKVIAEIGKKSGIVVQAANEETGAPIKYVSAHDLRRSCGQRLLEAGVPPLVISRILRHSSWQTTQKHYVPGNVQQDAKVLAKCLLELEP